jgi:hypothetical protein
MPRVGCEPAILLFERAKTAHALKHSATVIGSGLIYSYIYLVYRDKVFPIGGTFMCENVPGSHQGSCLACSITAPLAIYTQLTQGYASLSRRSITPHWPSLHVMLAL